MIEVENKVLVLKDMGSDEFTDIVMFDDVVDMKKIFLPVDIWILKR